MRKKSKDLFFFWQHLVLFMRTCVLELFVLRGAIRWVLLLLVQVLGEQSVS